MKMQIPSGYGGCSIRVQGRNRCTAQGKAHQGYSSWNTNGGSKHGKVLLLDQCSHEDFSPVDVPNLQSSRFLPNFSGPA